MESGEVLLWGSINIFIFIPTIFFNFWERLAKSETAGLITKSATLIPFLQWILKVSKFVVNIVTLSFRDYIRECKCVNVYCRGTHKPGAAVSIISFQPATLLLPTAQVGKSCKTFSHYLCINLYINIMFGKILCNLSIMFYKILSIFSQHNVL